MFTWTEQSRRWYAQAALRTDYHRRQAEACVALLGDVFPKDSPAGASFAEWGCGPGFLTLALSGLGLDVTGLDTDGECLAIGREEARLRGLSCRFEEADCLALPRERKWDVVVACHFADLAEDLETFRVHARRAILFFAPRQGEKPLVPGRPYRRRQRFADHVEADLRARGVPFESRDLTLEFGQPFADRDEAGAFLAHYSRGEIGADEMEVQLERLRVLEDGTLYLPHAKRLALFLVRPDTVPLSS